MTRISEEELKKFFDCCMKSRTSYRSMRVHGLVSFLCLTGMRLEEALALKVSDIGNEPNENGEIKIEIKGRNARTLLYPQNKMRNLILIYGVTEKFGYLFKPEKRSSGEVLLFRRMLKSNASQRIANMAVKAKTPNVSALNIRYTAILSMLEHAVDHPFEDEYCVDEISEYFGITEDTIISKYIPALFIDRILSKK